jgi:hypothetical protein
LADDAQQPPVWASSTLVRWRVSLSPTLSVGFGRPDPSSARTHEPFTLLNDRYAVSSDSEAEVADDPALSFNYVPGGG